MLEVVSKAVLREMMAIAGHCAQVVDECLTPVGLQEPLAPDFVPFYTHLGAGHTITMRRIPKAEGARKGLEKFLEK